MIRLFNELIAHWTDPGYVETVERRIPAQFQSSSELDDLSDWERCWLTGNVLALVVKPNGKLADANGPFMWVDEGAAEEFERVYTEDGLPFRYPPLTDASLVKQPSPTLPMSPQNLGRCYARNKDHLSNDSLGAQAYVSYSRNGHYSQRSGQQVGDNETPAPSEDQDHHAFVPFAPEQPPAHQAIPDASNHSEDLPSFACKDVSGLLQMFEAMDEIQKAQSRDSPFAGPAVNPQVLTIRCGVTSNSASGYQNVEPSLPAEEPDTFVRQYNFEDQYAAGQQDGSIQVSDVSALMFSKDGLDDSLEMPKFEASGSQIGVVRRPMIPTNTNHHGLLNHEQQLGYAPGDSNSLQWPTAHGKENQVVYQQGPASQVASSDFVGRDLWSFYGEPQQRCPTVLSPAPQPSFRVLGSAPIPRQRSMSTPANPNAIFNHLPIHLAYAHTMVGPSETASMDMPFVQQPPVLFEPNQDYSGKGKGKARETAIHDTTIPMDPASDFGYAFAPQGRNVSTPIPNVDVAGHLPTAVQPAPPSMTAMGPSQATALVKKRKRGNVPETEGGAAGPSRPRKKAAIKPPRVQSQQQEATDALPADPPSRPFGGDIMTDLVGGHTFFVDPAAQAFIMYPRASYPSLPHALTTPADPLRSMSAHMYLLFASSS
ncbi:hypothetical protein H0H87_002140 [Tephrocybe sp. NHM501043]|nr:hypothetical protein H0H87_002140 [Tephrocybe sp. NHM501043]